MNEGLSNTSVKSLAIDPMDPSKLHAGTDGGGVFSYQSLEPCAGDAGTLCLNGGRFSVRTRWSARDGSSGLGQAIALTEDTGYFTFFDSANVEVVVKILNGCGFNDRFWAFAGGLTDVSVVMTVTDHQTGAVRIYTTPGTALSRFRTRTHLPPVEPSRLVNRPSPKRLFRPCLPPFRRLSRGAARLPAQETRRRFA